MKHLFFISVLCFLNMQIVAQTIDKVQIEKTIDTIFKPLHQDKSPGVAVTVMQNGKVITKKNYGLANLEHSVPFTHQSPVRLIYSMGREFMSAGIAIMEAEGLLRFDDKVRSYLPKLPEWSKNVTIQDLLNHSSGFDDEWSLLLLMHADMRNRVDKEQMLTLLYNQPKPQVQPGEGYMYCNTDYALLRMIAEMASKQNLTVYLKNKLFAPLGMSATFMNDDIEAVIPGFAESYYGNGPFRKARFYKTSPGGNYRIVTTANDLEKWALAAADSSSVLAKAFERLYQDARSIPVMAPEQHYTFGHEWRKRDTLSYVFHGGVDDGFYMVRIPSQGIAVIALGNSSNSIAGLLQLTDSLLPPIPALSAERPMFPESAVVLTNSELKKYAGRYFEHNAKGYNSHVSRIAYYDIKAEGDSLQFYYQPGASFPLTAFGNGHFKDMEEDVPIIFSGPNRDGIMQFKMWLPNGEVKVYQQHENNLKINKPQLQQFVGKYYSPHLDYYFRVVLDEKDQLIVKRPTLSDVKLEPYGENSFLLQADTGGYFVYTVITFTRNKKGQVDGFDIRYSRLMHHRFEKVN